MRPAVSRCEALPVSWLGVALGSLAVFLASTVAFDAVHALLHAGLRSRSRVLRAAGGMHAVHHRFLDRSLRVHEAWRRANLLCHVIPEYLTQLAFSGALLLMLPARVVLPAVALETVVFLAILRARGSDINHRPRARVPGYRPLLFCLPEYHALHHVQPDAYLSSWIRTLDHLLGTGAVLSGRRVLLAGGGTAAGQALRRALLRAGARVEAVPGEPGALRALAGPGGRHLADALVVAGCGGETAARLVEAFLGAAAAGWLAPEVAVVDTGDCGSLFRRYRADPRLIYRHIPWAPEAPPQPQATRAVDLWRRGFHYLGATPGAWLRHPRLRGPVRGGRSAASGSRPGGSPERARGPGRRGAASGDRGRGREGLRRT